MQIKPMLLLPAFLKSRSAKASSINKANNTFLNSLRKNEVEAQVEFT